MLSTSNASCFNVKQIFVAGLTDCGQQELINALLKNDIITPDYQIINGKFLSALKRVEFTDTEIGEISSYVTKFGLEVSEG